jgi:hypothetical protein
MTFDEFVTFIESGQVPIYIYPYRIEPCRCGDINCRGWRLRAADVAQVARRPVHDRRTEQELVSV